MKAKIVNPKTDGEFNDFDPEADEMGRRYVEVEGKKYLFLVKDPHGFLVVRAEKGRTPDELSGQYTSQFEAEKAVIRYHAANPVKS